MSLAWRVVFGEGERVVLSGRPWADVADGDDVDVERFLAVEHTSLPGAPDAGHAFLPSRGSGGARHRGVQALRLALEAAGLLPR